MFTDNIQCDRYSITVKPWEDAGFQCYRNTTSMLSTTLSIKHDWPEMEASNAHLSKWYVLITVTFRLLKHAYCRMSEHKLCNTIKQG